MKSRLTDVHGIHLLDYEPYFSIIRETEKSELLSCSIKEGIGLIKKFSERYVGKIGVMGFASHFNINKDLADPLYYENQKVIRLIKHIKSNYSALLDSVVPYFLILPSLNYKKVIDQFEEEIQMPFGVKFQEKHKKEVSR